MKDRGYWNEKLWHGTKHAYTFEAGNTLEFTSVDYSKAHGPRRDILFANECNNLDYKTVDQLMTRTREIVWLDWNPSEEFWFYTELLPMRPDDIDFITLTYLDNEALDEIVIQEIESHKPDIAWWTVYGLGQLGATEQRIYKDWAFIDDIPFEARLERIGVDFGYTNDPTAIVAVYYYNGGYILDEITYQKGLLNKPIADILKLQPKTLIIADSAEPKSIDEIRSFGLTVLPCQKGTDSIRRGIGYVQQQRISVTRRSLNIIKEYRTYLWVVDKDGRITQEAMDNNNHAMDALRYAIASIKDPLKVAAHVHYPASNSPRNNLTPFQNSIQTEVGAPVDLHKVQPVTAYTHIPRL